MWRVWNHLLQWFQRTTALHEDKPDWPSKLPLVLTMIQPGKEGCQVTTTNLGAWLGQINEALSVIKDHAKN